MPNRFDLGVRNGTVIDGSGAEPRDADIARQAGRIATTGRFHGPHAAHSHARRLSLTPLRVLVMGRGGVDRERATADDMARMASLVEEGLAAGALGFSTSRSLFHRTSEGALTPTLTAAEEELAAIARGMARAGKGVIQLLDDFEDTGAEGATQFAMLRPLVPLSGRPLS